MELNAELHESDPSYGTGGHAVVENARFLSDMVKLGPFETVLDCGCGKGILLKHLRELQPNCRIYGYDPAVREYNVEPPICQFTYCTDVLEHIEPTFLERVLEHIASKTSHAGYFVVSTVRAQKTLKDGRNAHLIVKDNEWWAERINQHFNIVETGVHDRAAVFTVLAKSINFSVANSST